VRRKDSGSLEMNEEQKVYSLVKRLLKEYYEKHELPEVDRLDRREFAFGISSPKPNVRHKSFENLSQLMEFVRKNVPLSIHYSLAIYEAPWEPLTEKKGLVEREMALDIDVDASKFSSYHQMLDYAKQKVLQLLDKLKDLGFSKVEIWFSGSRGFHIYVKEKELYSLDREELHEIYLYLSLDLVNKEKFQENLLKKKSQLHQRGAEPPVFSSRELDFFKQLINYIINNYSRYLELGEKKPKPRAYFQRLLARFSRNPLEAIQYIKKDYIKVFFDDVFSNIQIPLDKQLIIDQSHLIRYPGSLNHKLCLLKTKIDDGKLEDFDPLEEASLVSDGWAYVIVKRKELWKYYGLGSPSSPLVKLPAKQALVLICSGAASYVRGELYI
jgi:predicted DNA primase small subunit